MSGLKLDPALIMEQKLYSLEQLVCYHLHALEDIVTCVETHTKPRKFQKRLVHKEIPHHDFQSIMASHLELIRKVFDRRHSASCIFLIKEPVEVALLYEKKSFQQR